MTSAEKELNNRMKNKMSKGELKVGEKVLVYNGWEHPGGPHEATIVSVRGALEFSVRYEDSGDPYFEPCDNDFDFTVIEGEEEQVSDRPTVGDYVQINYTGGIRVGEVGKIIAEEKDDQPFLVEFLDGKALWFFSEMVSKVPENSLKEGQRVKVEGSEHVGDGREGIIRDVDDTNPEQPYLVLFKGYPRQKWLRASDVTPVEDSEDKDEPVSEDEYRPFIDILSEVVDGQHTKKVITTDEGKKFVVGKTLRGLGLCEYGKELLVEATLTSTTLNGKAKVSKGDKEEYLEDLMERRLKELKGGE